MCDIVKEWLEKELEIDLNGGVRRSEIIFLLARLFRKKRLLTSTQLEILKLREEDQNYWNVYNLIRDTLLCLSIQFPDEHFEKAMKGEECFVAKLFYKLYLVFAIKEKRVEYVREETLTKTDSHYDVQRTRTNMNLKTLSASNNKWSKFLRKTKEARRAYKTGYQWKGFDSYQYFKETKPPIVKDEWGWIDDERKARQRDGCNLCQAFQEQVRRYELKCVRCH